MSFLKSVPTKLGQVLFLYGGWGLFAISFLDSSFVPFPTVNDLLLIHLSSQRPELALAYALQCTAGSLLGAYVMYGLARGGAQFLWRRSSPRAVRLARRWLQRNDLVAILVASLLPPPAPFKVFLLTAGALRVNAARFGAALLVSRSLRFVPEALLGARYGARAEAYVRDNFGWVSLVAAALIVGMTLVYHRLATRLTREGSSTPPDPSSSSPH